MRALFLILCICFGLANMSFLHAQDNDDWSKKTSTLRNQPEAELIIRVGDIDNLGFGWPEEFNPFSGKDTDAHGYPWEPNEDDPQGTDRIFVVSTQVILRQALMDIPHPHPVLLTNHKLSSLRIRLPELIFNQLFFKCLWMIFRHLFSLHLTRSC
jgi:hypothetical protein